MECGVEFRVLGVDLSTVFDPGLEDIGVGFQRHGGQMEPGLLEPALSGLVYLTTIQYRLYDKRFVAVLGSSLKSGELPSSCLAILTREGVGQGGVIVRSRYKESCIGQELGDPPLSRDRALST